MQQEAQVVMAGAGLCGMATSLLLARSGRRVCLVERDPATFDNGAEDALQMRRMGVPHFHQPHAFMPRAFALLRSRLPDVFDTLRSCGATQLDLAPADGPRVAGDEDLIFLGVRRPLVEWALRRAVRDEPGIEICRARITGLSFRDDSPPELRGLLTEAGPIEGSLVVDAMGRTSPTPEWLAARGIELTTESSDVGIVYYSRYYRLLDGADMPPAASPFGPRVDHVFASAATFIGDNRTYAIVVMVPTWDTELKALRQPAAFEAFCRASPILATLVDPARAAAITEILPMGALKTAWHGFEKMPVRRLVGIGDSFCHTDPSFALGISNALIHASALADAAAAHDDVDVAAAFYARVTGELRERFTFARDVCAARIERMQGRSVPISRTGCYPLYSLMATLACASLDPEIHRMAFRRHGFLDRLSQFDEDAAMQARVEVLFAQLLVRMRDMPRLERSELLALIAPDGTH